MYRLANAEESKNVFTTTFPEDGRRQPRPLCDQAGACSTPRWRIRLVGNERPDLGDGLAMPQHKHLLTPLDRVEQRRGLHPKIGKRHTLHQTPLRKPIASNLYHTVHFSQIVYKMRRRCWRRRLLPTGGRQGNAGHGWPHFLEARAHPSCEYRRLGGGKSLLAGEDTPNARRAFADPRAYLSWIATSPLQRTVARSSKSAEAAHRSAWGARGCRRWLSS